MKFRWKLWVPLFVVGSVNIGIISWVIVRQLRSGDENFEVFVKVDNDGIHPDWEDFIHQSTTKINNSNLSQEIKTQAILELKKQNKHIHFNDDIYLNISTPQSNGKNQAIVLKITIKKAPIKKMLIN